MTKKEIVRTISEEIGLTQLKTKEIVQKTFDAIVEALVEDGRIELRNFGVFEVKRRAPRKARNPRTGTKVDVPEKFVVTFKPGKEMEQRVRELERQAPPKPKPPLNETPRRAIPNRECPNQPSLPERSAPVPVDDDPLRRTPQDLSLYSFKTHRNCPAKRDLSTASTFPATRKTWC